MSGIFLYLFVAATGFTLAAGGAALFQWVTDEPLKFEIEDKTLSTAIPGVVARVVCGPFILMRNALRGRTIENRPAHWLALSSAISFIWSFFSGIVLIELLLRLGQ